MPELAFAAWTRTENAVAPTAITTTGANQAFDVEIVRSDTTTFSRSGALFVAHEAGRFFVSYDLGIQTAPNVVGTKVRSAVVSELRVNGSSTPYGRAQGYTRNASGCARGTCAGGAVLELAEDDEVSVFAQRVDTAGDPSGSTSRDAGAEGQIALWRLRDSWPIFRARITADLSATSGNTLVEWDTVDVAEDGWTYDGSGSILFDWEAAGFATPDVVFLVAFCLEAEASGSARGVFETACFYAAGESAIALTYRERAYQASYVSGGTLSGIIRAVCAWSGLVSGSAGEAPLHADGEGFRFFYRHANTTATTFTPKADRGSVQIVAIPRAELAALGYFIVREQGGGQAADVDAALSLDSTVFEQGGGFEHDPSGADDSEVRCGEGGWLLLFGQAYVLASAARNGNRLSHRLRWEVDGVAPEYGKATGYNRGTDGCNTASHSTKALLYADPGQDLRLFADNAGSLTDTAADFAGPVIGTSGQLCAAQGILLRSQVKRPDPVLLGLAVAQPARLVTATPAPVELELLVATPQVVGGLSPDPVELELLVAQPARLLTATPAPVELGLAVAQPARLVTATPAPVELELLVATPALLLAIAPDPVELELLVAAPLVRQHQDPAPVLLGLAVAQPARLVTVTPAPVELELLVAQPARLLTTTPAPVELELLVATPARLLTATPAPVLLGLAVAAPIRGVLFSLELRLGLVRRLDLRAALGRALELEPALERALELRQALEDEVGVHAQLELAALLEALLGQALELRAPTPQAALLRAQASSAAPLIARLERARAVHAELARTLGLQAPIGRSLSTTQPVE